MAFMILATGLYLNAWLVYAFLYSIFPNFILFLSSAKGEECIPQTWDMYHEKYVTLN